MAALLSLHPWQELLEIVEFGTVWDGQPADQVRVLEDDERISFLLDGERSIAAAVDEPFDIDPATIPAIWGEPRFVVCLLYTSPSPRDS